VLTAVTAQNTRGVLGVSPVPAPFVRLQMEAVFPDLRPAAVKIGMLFDDARVREVARGLARHRAKNVVLDPVLAATDGVTLLAARATGTLRRELFPLCDLVTPNRPEAEELSGIRIRNPADARRAAEVLAGFGAGAVLIKGGHARGSDVEDLLFDGRRFRNFVHPRIATRARHGTGCTLSAAIAARLALGAGLAEAVEGAIGYLQTALVAGVFPGRGRGVPGRFARAAVFTPSRARGTRDPDKPIRRRP
jgi:hydroxymethylpyrimidine/phosphomethylpyrimidine kinase